MKGHWYDEILLVLEVENKKYELYKVFVLFCNDKDRVGNMYQYNLRNQYKATIKNLMDENL